jgi:hypothetical protein
MLLKHSSFVGIFPPALKHRVTEYNSFRLVFMPRLVSSLTETVDVGGDTSLGKKLNFYNPNFPQGRMTDYRIGLTLYTLDAVMNGEIQEVLDKLQFEENTERLKEQGVS